MVLAQVLYLHAIAILFKSASMMRVITGERCSWVIFEWGGERFVGEGIRLDPKEGAEALVNADSLYEASTSVPGGRKLNKNVDIIL